MELSASDWGRGPGGCSCGGPLTVGRRCTARRRSVHPEPPLPRRRAAPAPQGNPALRGSCFGRWTRSHQVGIRCQRRRGACSSLWPARVIRVSSWSPPTPSPHSGPLGLGRGVGWASSTMQTGPGWLGPGSGGGSRGGARSGLSRGGLVGRQSLRCGRESGTEVGLRGPAQAVIGVGDPSTNGCSWGDAAWVAEGLGSPGES